MTDSQSTEVVSPTLAASSYAFARWYLAVASGVFCRARSATLGIVFCRTLAQFGQMLAFFLPLKVLLLIGSEGIPKYFEFFIEPSKKNYWVTVLALLTPVIYLTTVILFSQSRRLATKGARQLVGLRFGSSRRRASKTAFKRIRRQYDNLCQSVTDVSITIIGCAALMIMNSFVTVMVIAWMTIHFIITNWILNNRHLSVADVIGDRITRRPDLYVQYSVEVAFLVFFGVLIGDFIVSGDVNLIVAILTLLLGRRTLPAAGRYIRRSVQIERQRYQVERVLGIRVSTD